MTRVLGIDPGTHRVGWAVIDGTPSRSLLVGCDCLEFSRHTTPGDYLRSIQTSLEALLLKYHPDKIGIESLFMQKNLKTAISVAQARGVILYTFAKLGYTWVELSPNSVKSAVGGSGSAGKLEVARMVGLLLDINTAKYLDDVTDALAVALAVQVTKL